MTEEIWRLADELGNIWARGVIDRRVRIRHNVRQMHPRHLLHEVQEVVSECRSSVRQEHWAEQGGAPRFETCAAHPLN